MTRYILITALLIVFIIALAAKQAPHEPEIASPDVPEDILSGLETGEPVVSESGNIKVERPQPGATISSPVLVRGQARAFEGTFHIRLKDSDGKVVVEKTGTASAEEAGDFGTFGELLLFDDVATDEGAVEVYTVSAEDGSEQDLASIPVKF